MSGLEHTIVVVGINRNVSDAKAQDALLIETAKAFLQLVGIVIIGGAIKLLYDDFTEQRRQTEKTREQERARQGVANDIRKELLSDLIAARSRVEEARIRYRIEESRNPIEQYRETILAVLEARLSLSRIWNAIETANYLFVEADDIKKNINRMKLYLDGLIREYESEIMAFREKSDKKMSYQIQDLEVFGDFVSDKPETNYGAEFLVRSYRPAVSEIRREVLLANEVELNKPPTTSPEPTVERS